jgi:hypothetical protein
MRKLRGDWILIMLASIQSRTLLSSRLLSKNKTKIRIYKTIILHVVLYGYKIRYLKVREDHRLKLFEGRLLRRIFGPKRDEVTDWRNCIVRSFLTCALRQI